MAIALVVCAHGSGTGWYSTPRASVVLADLGVRAFFVLSGFLITSLLLDERARTRAISLRGFYARRALRIVPALAVYVAIVWLARGATAHDVGVAASFTMNFHGHRGWLLGHTWSLAVEEQFYIVWPAIVAFATFAGGRNAALAALVIGPIARLALLYAAPEYRAISDQAFPCVADALATGCLVAILREWLACSPAWNALVLADWFWPAAILALASGFVGKAWFALGIAPTLDNVAIGAVMYRCLLRPEAALPALLSRPAIVKLGVISYSLYLWQQVFMNRHASGWYCAFPLNIALAVACAIASYQLVEKPFLRLSARLRAARGQSGSVSRR